MIKRLPLGLLMLSVLVNAYPMVGRDTTNNVEQDTTQQQSTSSSATVPIGNDDSKIDWKKVDMKAHGKFDKKAKGTVKIGGNWQEQTDVEIIIEGGLDENVEYDYGIYTNPINSNGDCNTAGEILNPVSIALNVECSKDKTEYCIEGDLSAKHGKLKSNEGGKAKTKFSDNYLRFFPQPFSVLGRSIVITNNGTKYDCTNVTSKLDKTEEEENHGEEFKPTGLQSTYQTDYRQPSVENSANETKVTPFKGSQTVDKAAVPSKSNPSIKESPSIDPNIAVLDDKNTSDALSSHRSTRAISLALILAMIGMILI